MATKTAEGVENREIGRENSNVLFVQDLFKADTSSSRFPRS